MEPLTLSFTAALFMGLAFGAGPCNITCLPYLGPVFLRESNGKNIAWRTIIPFSLGRLSSYSMLGGVAGGFGYAATSWLESGYAGYFLGVATIVIGLLMIRRSMNGKFSCDKINQPSDLQQEKKITFQKDPPGFSFGLFAMGAGMALNPCIPLATVLTVSAAMANPYDGLMLGLAFGVGAVAIPAIIFGFAVAHFSEQIRYHLSAWRGRLEKMAGSMLVLLGGFTLMGWIQP